MTVRVDATDVDHGIFAVNQTIPIAQSGPMTLLLPEWLPGTHEPEGPIDKIAGIVFTAGGRTLTWKRDPVDVFAFHIDVPEGAKQVEVAFQYLTPTTSEQGKNQVASTILRIQWEKVSMYPAGYFVRQIPVSAIVTYPTGWKATSALRPASTSGDTIRYESTNYEVFVDSPVLAGKYSRVDTLSTNVTLATYADAPADLIIKPDILDKHKALIVQADRLFGARHYDHYDFLLSVSAVSDQLGLEHHRSSEDGVDHDYFTDWDSSLPDHNLLPHEYTHSWNGKFRRGADLWTPDYHTPMRDSLLWVYEGQTQFWGYVLEARSGLATKQQTLDSMASIAADLDTLPARTWRSLDDTTNDPIMSQRRPKGWVSWQRSEDYYNEGLLIWTEVDAIIRGGTKGGKGMDDFAKAFFGINNGDFGEVTYTFDDVVKTLNGIYAYDWATYLNQRLTEKSPHAPLGGFTRSGYTLIYTDTPSSATKASMKSNKKLDLTYSLGAVVAKSKLSEVSWNGPAYKAGLTVGQEIIAVDGIPYSEDALKTAITAAKNGTDPIRLTVKTDDRVRDVSVRWNGGLKYPHFQKTGAGDGALDKLLAPR